jgi:hypothetical protein
MKNTNNLFYIVVTLSVTLGASLHVVTDALEERVVPFIVPLLSFFVAAAAAWVFRRYAEGAEGVRSMHTARVHAAHVFTDGLLIAVTATNALALGASLIRIIGHETILLPVIMRVSRAKVFPTLVAMLCSIVAGIICGLVFQRWTMFVVLSVSIVSALPAYTLWQLSPFLTQQSPRFRIGILGVSLVCAIVLARLAHLLH